MENNLTNSRSSQRSTSSISGINHSIGNNSNSTSNNNNSSAYVNHALILWTEQRRLWVGDRQRSRPPQPREAVLSNFNPTYEELLSTNRPFVRPIPLSEMVDFLVEVWDQEGHYD